MSVSIVNAIIYEQKEIDENTKIFKCFCKEYGIIVFYALGTEKLESKNRYALNNLSNSELEIFRSSCPNKLSKLKRAILLNGFYNISDYLDLYMFCITFLNLIDIFIEKNKKCESLFNLTYDFIDELNNYPNKGFQSYVLVLVYFLNYVGGMWNLSSCYKCSRMIKYYLRFDFQNKAFVCSKCINGLKKHPSSFTNLLKNISCMNYKQCNKYDYDIEDLVLLNSLLINYYEQDLGIKKNIFKYFKKTRFTKISQEKLRIYYKISKI